MTDQGRTTGTLRKLVTIFAADFVSFSKLMARDEEGTAAALKKLRAIIDGIIDLHGGRIFNTAGDSVFAEFSSPVEAVRAGLEIQTALKTKHLDKAHDNHLALRIGINLGDVIVKGPDFLGDAVNVAARLEGLAEPGGIVISSSVYDQIVGKLTLSFENIGEPKLKNIDRSIRVYRACLGAKEEERSSVRSGVKNAAILIAALVVSGAALAVWLGTRTREAQAGHWLDGQWIGLMSLSPAESAKLCDQSDPRCLIFKVDGVGSNGKSDGIFGSGSRIGPAAIEVAKDDVDFRTRRVEGHVRKHDDGSLRGSIRFFEDGSNWSVAFRRYGR